MKMQRRQFLKLVAGVVVGAAAVRTLVWDLQAAKATNPVLDSFVYKGHTVEIVEIAPDHVVMSLDGRQLPHYAFMRLQPDTYSSHLLPFRDEHAGRLLAERLIDGDGTLFIL